MSEIFFCNELLDLIFHFCSVKTKIRLVQTSKIFSNYQVDSSRIRPRIIEISINNKEFSSKWKINKFRFKTMKPNAKILIFTGSQWEVPVFLGKSILLQIKLITKFNRKYKYDCSHGMDKCILQWPSKIILSDILKPGNFTDPVKQEIRGYINEAEKNNELFVINMWGIHGRDNASFINKNANIPVIVATHIGQSDGIISKYDYIIILGKKKYYNIWWKIFSNDTLAMMLNSHFDDDICIIIDNNRLDDKLSNKVFWYKFGESDIEIRATTEILNRIDKGVLE